MNHQIADIQFVARPEYDPLSFKAEELLTLLDDLREKVEGSALGRRLIVDRLIASLKPYCETAASLGVSDVDSLQKLLDLVSAVECTSPGSQRFDHRMQRLDWALRRFIEVNQGRAHFSAQAA